MIRCQTTRKLTVKYSAPVHDCTRELRVIPPPQRAGQKLVELDWHCDPPPDSTQETSDDFGTRVLQIHHQRIAKQFDFEMTMSTSHDAGTPVPTETNLPPNGIGAFLLPSALCDWTLEIQHAANELTGATPLEICKYVFRRLEYSSGSTTLETRASQTLESGHGVCQDFAHLMIALCRAMKLPARYISGYIPGEGAMHAWVEVLLHGQWRGFDPTHTREARTDYVFVACGRDFRDCRPHLGNYSGSTTALLQSFCKTTQC